MRRSTIIGLFVGMLALTMNAQVTQSSTSRSNSGTSTVENQKKPAASIQELLTRYQNLGSKNGSISEYFSKEEQQLLQSYFKSKSPKTANLKETKEKNISLASPEKASTNVKYTPLFVDFSNSGKSSNNVALPAAYKNRSVSSVGETTGKINNGKRNFDLNANVPFTGRFYSKSPNAIVYDNGPYFNIAGTPDVSLLEDTSLAMSLFGAGAQFTANNRMADEVVLTDTYDITSIDVFAYQTGSIAPSITAVYMQVWDGDPSGGGATVIWGDLTTNVLDVAAATNAFRQLESAPGATNREIQRVTANTTGLSLSAGTYWIDYTFAGSGASGPWAPPIAITGNATTGNAIQFLGASNAWAPLIDAGSNTPQGMPFVIYGDLVGGGGGCPIVSDCNLSDVTPDDATSSDIWDRPFADGTCCSGLGPVSYDVYGPFTVDVSGLYTIDSDQDGGAWDGYLFLYETCFDPLDQTTNFVAGDDDGPGGLGTSQILDINLTAGTEYYIITTGFGAGDFGAFTTTISGVGTATCGGGGGGTACSESNPSNNFEDGFTSSNNTAQVIAADITVAADTDFSLEAIQANWLVFDGEVIASADITIYGDLAGLPDPSNVIATLSGVVPTSQAVIGDFPASPILDVLDLNFDITPEVLNGQAGVTTTYWISIYVDNTTANGSFWEFSTASTVGNDGAFSLDNGATWGVALPGSDQVYEFSGQCEPIGGGGGGVLDTAYGVNNGNFELIGFPVSDPSMVEVFGNSPITNPALFENAGAIDPANPTTGYALDNGGNFYSFDVESGFYTSLGSIPGDWVGMEFDQSSGILYAIAGADLYTIDPVAVSATLVGATGIPPGNFPIALAIDGAGVGYTYEVVTDNLYSIDLATATATLIGNIGFDANFGQGMCYDALTDTVYMAAFNNATFAAEWRSVNVTNGASTLIGPIVTTAVTTQVAWVSIGETLPPPACPEPTNLAVTNIAPDSADLSWTAEPNASNGYIWYVFVQGDNPVSDPPVATGTVPAGTTTATATGLSGGFNYDFYVVADCDTDGLSQLAGPVTFATPPSCGGKFYDTGGPGANYQDNENVTTVINPVNAGEQVTVTFTAFDVEETWDALYVYDGPDTSSPLISSGNPPTNSGFPAGGFYGTSIIGPFTSSHSSGALTFVFLSDSSVPRAGWEADVTCALSPPPNDMIVNSIDVDEIGVPYTDPGVHMPAATTEDGNPQGCDLTGANGVWYNFVAAGDGTAIASIVTPGGASSVTFYTAPDESSTETDLVLVPQNSNQCAPGTSTSIFTLGGQAYYVFVLNSGAITDIVIDGTNLSVSDNTIEGFSYYPNPTNGILNLKSVENIENVSLYNLLGQIVIDNRVNATTSLVDISGLSTGTYLMKVTVNGQIGTYRVLKQ